MAELIDLESVSPQDMTTLTTVSGFDLEDLERIVAEVLGSVDEPATAVGERLVAEVVDSIAENTEGRTPQNIREDPRNLMNILSRLLAGIHASRDMGPRVAQKIQNVISNQDMTKPFAAQRREIAERDALTLQAYPDPLTFQEGKAQIKSFYDYMIDSFNQDQMMRTAITTAMKLTMDAYEGIEEVAADRDPVITASTTNVYGQIVGRSQREQFYLDFLNKTETPGAELFLTILEETLRGGKSIETQRNRVEGGTGEDIPMTFRGVATGAPDVASGSTVGMQERGDQFDSELSSSELESLIKLLDNFMHEWETGRADMPFDHATRSEIVKRVEAENGSPRSFDLLSNGRIATRQIRFIGPEVALGLNRMTNEEIDLVSQLRNNRSFKLLPPQEQQRQIQWKSEQMANRVTDYVWESSLMAQNKGTTLEGDPFYTPEGAAFTREYFNEGFTERLLESVGLTMVNEDPLALVGLEESIIDVTTRFQEDLLRAATPGGLTATEVSLGSLERMFFEMDDKRFRELQLGAFYAGAYEDVNSPYKSIDEIPWGSREDMVVRSQWDNAIMRSHRQSLLGREITVESIFDEATRMGSQRLYTDVQDLRDQADDLRALGVAPDMASIVISQPVTIIAQADAIAQKEMGRNATPEERRLLISLVQSQQKMNGARLARFDASLKNQRFFDEADVIDRRADMDESTVDLSLAEAQIKSKTISGDAMQRATEGGDTMFLGPSQDDTARDLARLRQESTDQAAEGLGDVGDGVSPGGALQIEEFEEFDAAGFMRKYLKTHNAGDVQSHQVRKGFDTFIKALSSPIQI